MTDLAGKISGYAYDSNNNLSTVTYPDGKVRTYHYEDPAHTHALRITDENGDRYARSPTTLKAERSRRSMPVARVASR